MTSKSLGAIEWLDLTVDDADGLRDFYSQVVGWQAEAVSMGDYNDYNMNAADGNTITGICHARGSNAALPAQWLSYVRVADVADSAEHCRKMGGDVIDGPRSMAGSQFCVIRDPAGAVLALISD